MDQSSHVLGSDHPCIHSKALRALPPIRHGRMCCRLCAWARFKAITASWTASVMSSGGSTPELSGGRQFLIRRDNINTNRNNDIKRNQHVELLETAAHAWGQHVDANGHKW